MIRRLINRLQGRVWSAECHRCTWDAGRNDLTELQAFHRASAHVTNQHGCTVGILSDWVRKKQVVLAG